MTETPKYGLNKPEGSDYAKIAALNENADLLEAALEGLEAGKADDGHGHTPAEVGSDPAGSAAAVDEKLEQHTGKKDNPHGVTAAQAGAIPVGQKGVAGGVAPLGADNLVPVSYLPSQVKERRVVGTIPERDAIGEKFSGLQVYVKDATADPTVKAGGADYLWDGAVWAKTGEAESMDVVLNWENVLGKPGAFPAAAHSHTKADVGLGSVDNTRDADKPVSAAQLAALNGKAASTHAHQVSEITGALKKFGPANITIPLSGWTGTGPWTQNVAVSGVLAAWDWRLTLGLQKQTNTDTRKAQEKAMGCVAYCDTYNGGVTLTCYEKKPEVSILAVLSGEV